MTEIEQLLEGALLALMHYPLMTPFDKARLCDRLERMASNAAQQFRAQDDAQEEAREREWERQHRHLFTAGSER